MDAEFNETYYAAVAQIMPVLMLALMYDTYWRPGKARSPGLGLINMGVVIVFLLGEFVALNALVTGTEPSEWEATMVGYGLIVPIARLFVPRFSQALQDAFGNPQSKLSTAIQIAVMVGTGVLLVLLFLGVMDMRNWLMVAFVVALGLLGLGLQQLSREGDDDPPEKT
jgi:hypothetical protein